jgi:hypothetical protein
MALRLGDGLHLGGGIRRSLRAAATPRPSPIAFSSLVRRSHPLQASGGQWMVNGESAQAQLVRADQGEGGGTPACVREAGWRQWKWRGGGCSNDEVAKEVGVSAAPRARLLRC